ncbi:MAG TPA: tetratricopeptide repeat protein [Flavobacterium lutivivi]|nr:tetratricopeptide repeat protein [Flavobacterium lutivivi]
MKGIIISSMLMFCNVIFSQSSEGYWDNVRTTNETINLSAGKRTVIKSTDLPDGTTEAVFRISILDDNQKLASSLVSLLKSIPDPTGISQGSAGAVYLLSTISGDDKCKYAIFNNEKDALQYQKTGEAKNACFVQNTPINKEAKLLTESSSCVSNSSKNLWIGFESDNWFMKQKIVFELVPWVNEKLSRGWTIAAKKIVLDEVKKLDIISSIAKKNEFAGTMLDLISKKMTYKEFKNLFPEEKQKIFSDLTFVALKETKEDKILSELNRKKSEELFNVGKKEAAITMLENTIASASKSVSDYNFLGKYYILTLQYEKALKTLKTAEKIDESNLNVKLNLAHAYVLTDDFKKAKEIHKRFAGQNISADVSWKQQTKSDFTEFEKQGVNSKYFSKILKLLK